MAYDIPLGIGAPGSITAFLVDGFDLGPPPPPPYAARVIADGASYYWRLNETSGSTAFPTVGAVNATYSGVTLNQAGPMSGDPAVTIGGGTVTTVASVTQAAAVTFECFMKLPLATG